MTIHQATDLSNKVLDSLGFIQDEAHLISQNLIEAELAGKKTHGLIRLPAIAKGVKAGKINVKKGELRIISEHPGSLHIDGNYKSGFYVIYKSLEKAFKKIENLGLLAVSIKDISYASGYIGDYARRAAEKDLIFIGFNNSPGGLVPHGTTKGIWGTNPVTIGVPSADIPVILDMAAAQTTWGDILLAQTEGKKIKTGVAIDAEGKVTTDPDRAVLGGILPIAGHKGSGLGLIVELLAGGLSNSRMGEVVAGGWGSFYILIDPGLFRDVKEFKEDVSKVLNELKSTKKAEGVKEVFFPGEQSYFKRKKSLEKNEIIIGKKLLEQIQSLLL